MANASKPQQRAKRGQGKYPCPCKEDLGCDKMFSTQDNANRHAKEAHQWTRPDTPRPNTPKPKSPRERAQRGSGEIPCPCKEDLGCDQMFAWEEGANRHAKEAHQWTGPDSPKKRAQAGLGQIPCPCKLSHNCDKMYTRTGRANAHAREKHGYGEILEMIARAPKRAMEGDESSSPRKRAKAERECSLCPSEETDISDKTSTVEVEVTRHSKDEQEHIEPEVLTIDKADIQYSHNEDGLLEMRDQQGNVISYPAQHREAATFPCPLAEDEQCTKMYPSQEAADNHARKKHGFCSLDLREGEVPCILAEQKNCKRMFKTDERALRHAFCKHKMRFGEYHCPEDGCDEVLFELGKCEQHLRDKHGISSESLLQDKLNHMEEADPYAHLEPGEFHFQCPTRDTKGCLYVSRTPWHLEHHVIKRHPEDFDPVAGVQLMAADEKDGLKMIFRDGREVPAKKDLPQPEKKNGLWICQDKDCDFTSTWKHSVLKHYLTEHMDVLWVCRHSEKLGCNATFETPEAEWHHSADHYYRWKCQFPWCVANARNLLMTNAAIKKHKMTHEKHGHLNDDTWHPERVEIDPSVRQVNECDVTEEEEMAASDDCEDVEDRDWLDDKPSIDDEILEAISILGHQSTIKSSDLSLDGRDPQQDPQVRTLILKIVGNRCMGPNPVHQLRVSAPCPHNVIFTEENVILVHNPNTDSTNVSRRCHICRARMEFCRLAKALHMDKKPDQVYCSFRDCNSPIFASSAFCRDHILKGSCQLTEDPDLGPELMINLQSQFKTASSNLWQLKGDSFLGQEVLSRIKSGVLEKSGMPLVVCIDLEACLKTKRVFQVGICDLEGRKLLDCHTILSREEMRRTSADPGGRDEILQTIFERKARSLPSADGHMSVEQVSARLRKLFPRPEEVVFISWAKRKFDLSYLRDWLEAAGHSGVLPGDDRCYLVMQDFKYNLDRILGKTTIEGRTFPLKLPIFFPLVMGEGHRLSGRNHHALVDTQQLALLVNRLAVLCQETGSARQIPDPIPSRQTKLSFARANS